MKLLFKHTWFASAIFLFLTGEVVTSCADYEEEFANQYVTGGLQFSPKLFGLDDGLKTRADGDLTDLISPLREDYMGKKLDVFVVGNGDNNASFFNRYSFSENQIQEKYYLMEDNWKHMDTQREGYNGVSDNAQYVIGDKYKLYALVNYEGPAITTLDELKAAKAGYRFNSTTEAYESTNDIYKRYSTETPGRYDAWTANKLFTMDGCSGEFTFAASENDKKIDVDIKRAAAKIVLDLKIAPEFLKKIKTQETNDEGTVEIINAGNPRFRPVSFNYHAYAVDNIDGRDELAPLFANQSMYNIPATQGGVTAETEVENPKREYQLTTYCYPFDWSDNVTEKAPCLIVSVGFNNQFYYYHIPITQASVKELKRNHVYHIDATIVGYGALRAEDELEKVVNLHYDVIPWADSESDVSIVDVTSDLKFLLVDPTFTKMYGDGTEQTIINYYAATGAPVKWKIDEVYYYNASNQKITGSGTGTGQSSFWKGATATPGEGSKIVVSSEALDNKAVKYIKMTVWLDEDGGNDVDSSEKSVKVTIKHFTQQSLQNISGKWSSRWDGASSTTIEYSFNPTADGWDSYDGYDDDYECTLEEYNSAEQEHRNSSTEIRTIEADREDFLANVTSNEERTNANSEGNRKNGYWGETAIYTGYANREPNLATINSNWDFWSAHYYQSINGVRTYGVGSYVDDGYYNQYKYQKYYFKGEITTYTARRYYREVKGEASTGSWTDYENGGGSTWRNYQIDYNNWGYRAKWFDETSEICRQLQGNGYASNEDANVSKTNGKNNNHMYVIQVTEASAEYTIGHAELNGNYQSNNNVVSPAFMIASQLGAVNSSAFSAATAAQHCRTYMEVDNDKTRYTGWRLPTQAEVAYVVNWQNKSWDTIDKVLGGYAYYTLNLDNNNHRYATTGYGNSSDGVYVRCVRDLTAEEVKALNDKTE